MKRELRDASSYISKILREGDEYYKETKVSPEYQSSINLESTTLFLHRLVHTQSALLSTYQIRFELSQQYQVIFIKVIL